jgi:hypothetical protein
MQNRNIKGTVNILDLIYYKRFRTVDSPMCVGCGCEYFVNIILKDSFRKKLKFKTPYHGQLFAYASLTTNMKKLMDDYNFDYKNVRVDLADWDERFLLSFEQDNREAQFFCSSKDVKFILENCVRIPEERKKNDMK